MLPLIALCSNTFGNIYIDNQWIGDVTKDEYTSFIGKINGKVNVTFVPLNNFSHSIYSVLSFTITFNNGNPQIDCPFCNLVHHKQNTFWIDLYCQKLLAHSIPVCVGYKHIGEKFIASVIYNGGYYIVIEDKNRELPDSFFKLNFNSDEVELISCYINSIYCLVVYNKHNQAYIFTQKNGKFELSLDIKAKDVIINSNSILVKYTTNYEHIVKNEYTIVEDNLKLIKSSYNFKQLQILDSDIICDFLECLNLGIQDVCTKYLEEDLDFTFADLQEFFGDYNSFSQSPFDKNIYLLKKQINYNTFTSSQFTFTIKNSKINNIEEL